MQGRVPPSPDTMAPSEGPACGATTECPLPQPDPTQPILLLAGPTASGKSALAVALAEAIGGWVINADSMQVYDGLAILTARPDAAMVARAPHRLYGVLAPTARGSAGWWQQAALAQIVAAQTAGAIPILVGGTGLYFRTLTQGLVETPSIPESVRREARRRLAAEGPEGLHRDLARRDPAMAARLEPGDRQRLQRAWEVLEATGESLALWQQRQRPAPPADYRPVVLLPPRPTLYQACNARFRSMVERGAVEEVRVLEKRLRSEGICLEALAPRAAPAQTEPEPEPEPDPKPEPEREPDPKPEPEPERKPDPKPAPDSVPDARPEETRSPDLPLLKALGVPALRAHLHGALGLEDAILAAQQATRHYAKRQMTWFRHQMTPRLVLDRQLSESTLRDYVTILRDKVLT